DRFDDQSNQTVPVIRVLEPRIGLDDRRALEIGPQFRRIMEGPAIAELPGVVPLPDEPSTVGEQLGDGHPIHRGMEVADVIACRVVELEPLLLAQLHDAGGGEALRMRGDAKAVARGQGLAAHEIREAEGPLEHDLAAMCDGDDTTGLLRHRHLEVDPLRDVVERALEPAVHGHASEYSGLWPADRDAVSAAERRAT